MYFLNAYGKSRLFFFKPASDITVDSNFVKDIFWRFSWGSWGSWGSLCTLNLNNKDIPLFYFPVL